MYVFVTVVEILCGILLLVSGFWVHSKAGQGPRPSRLRKILAVALILSGAVMVGSVVSGTVVLPLH